MESLQLDSRNARHLGRLGRSLSQWAEDGLDIGRHRRALRLLAATSVQQILQILDRPRHRLAHDIHLHRVVLSSYYGYRR